MIRRFALALLSVGSVAHAQSADWPVFGGNANNSHYSTLGQITPANVKQLRVAWRYDTHQEFKDSEMQANPIVVDGVLYAETPKLHVFALDAASGRLLWSFDPNGGKPPLSRFRHRGVVVTGDRVLFTYRNKLWALDKKSGLPIQSFGDSGSVDMRAGLDRPVAGVTVSASTPGVVYEDMLIIGSTVSETLPGSPGDIRAYDIKTGALRWSFHTIPHPGELGYETWPPDAWKVNGGANAWSGVTVDQKRGIVFAATGSASFDFYGANRLGDDLFANTLLAIDAHTGKRIWHFQGVKHDLWDWDFPAAPTLVTVQRDGHDVDAVAQITKTGFVYVFDRATGKSLFPIQYRGVYASPTDGERASLSQPYPLSPPPFARQSLTEKDLTTRTPKAHAAALKQFREYATRGMYDPPNTKGTIIFPGVDGGGEWGGPAFDPTTGLLYVNSNEMPWFHKLVERNDRSLYGSNCATCHGDTMKGSPAAPSLVGVGDRHPRADIAKIIREGGGRMPGFSQVLDNGAVNDLVNFLITGHDVAESAGTNPNYQKYRDTGLEIFLDPDGYPAIKPPWGTLNAIDLNAGTIRWKIPFGEYPALAAKGLKNTGTDNYGGAIVTENGLLIIGATTYDNKFHIFDKLTGKLLWEFTLPAAGNATPSTYMVNGKQYIVIGCGGGKNGAKSGGTYVAFALPE
ncbi:MAG: Pyrrolo-quinoline quinone beta-propeller repeat-containing protein [Gemmatimonadetes bacterium]|nr:Pyrrolo-quinoline quinone beta-propeller repeat-containing protein [Gemmatimonadota bacterium]